MKLLSGGCSLIYGSELPDSTEHYSKLTYPSLVAKYLGLEYDCVATPGDGNDAICRKVIEAVDSDVGFVIVNWSWHDRFEFHHSKYGWQSLRHPNNQYKDDFSQLSKLFYTHLTEEYSWSRYLQNIIVLQNFLLDKKIPFIFSSADENFFESNNPITTNKFYQNLYNLIDFDRWFFWTDREGHKVGINKWCRIYRYPLGPGIHPLELGHYKTFELVKDRAKELL